MAEPQTGQESVALRRQNVGGDGAVTRQDQETAHPTQRVTVPCDVYENDEEYLLVADMPGLGAEECEVVIRGDRLELKGMRTLGDQSISYERSFSMPHNAETKDVSAS
jgi:HSP20 family molecular chaperone IbpA